MVPMPSHPSHKFSRARSLVVGLTLLLLTLETSTLLHAEEQRIILQLRNGDQISGILLSENKDRVRLRHPVLGVVRIPADDIVRRGPNPPTPTNAVPATAPTGVASATPPPPPPPPVSGTTAIPPTPKPVPVLPVTPPKPTPTPAPKHWSFDLQAGIDLGFGATDRQLYNGRIHAAYNRDRLRQSFDYLFTFGKTAGIKSADRMDGMFKTDYEIGHRLFLYNLGGVGYDNVRLINERYELGPGIGYHAIRRDKVKLNVELGGNYQVHQFSDGTESESFFYRIAEDSIWQITPKLSIDQKFEFFPGISEFDRYRMRFEGNLRYALRGNIYLNVTALDIYDNRPASGVSKNDLQLRSSVGVKF